MSLWHYVNDGDEIIGVCMCVGEGEGEEGLLALIVFAHIYVSRIAPCTRIATGFHNGSGTGSICPIHIIMVAISVYSFHFSNLNRKGHRSRQCKLYESVELARKISWQFFVFGRRRWTLVHTYRRRKKVFKFSAHLTWNNETDFFERQFFLSIFFLILFWT